MADISRELNLLYSDCKKKKKVVCTTVEEPEPEPVPTPAPAPDCKPPKELLDQIAKLKRDLDDLRALYAESERKYQAFVAKQQAIDKAQENNTGKMENDYEVELGELRAKLAAAENEKIELAKRVKSATEQSETLDLVIKIMKEEYKELKEKYTQERERLVAFDREMTVSREKLQALVNKYQEQVNEQLANCDRAETAAALKVAELEAKLENANEKLKRIELEKSEAIVEKQEAQVREADAAKQAAEVATINEDFLALIASLQDDPQAANIASKLPGLMNSDAILRSKKQSAVSVFADYVNELLQFVRGYARSVNSGKIAEQKDALDDFNKVVKQAQGIAKALRKGAQPGSIADRPGAATTEAKGTVEAFGNYFILLAEKVRTFLSVYNSMQKKGQLKVVSTILEPTLGTGKFSTANTDATFASYVKSRGGKDGAVLAEQVLNAASGVYDAAADIVAMTMPERPEQIDEDREFQFYAFIKAVLLYGAAYLSDNATDVKRAVDARSGFVAQFKEVATQWYGILTGDGDTTLLEKAKKKAKSLNPFKAKDQVPAAARVGSRINHFN